MSYKSKFTGEQVDEYLTRIEEAGDLLEIREGLSTKADKSGYYPQLHVGLSDNLPDRGDVTEGLIGFRESAGADNSIEDGTANVQELLGESVVWNQLQNNVGDILIDGTNKNVVGSKLEFTAIESKAGGNMYQRNLRVKVIANHKYIILSDCVNSRGLTPRIHVQASSYAGNIGDVFTNSSNGEIILFPFGTSETINIGDVATLSYLSVYDLTQMFGAGKEPSTIEEFNARKNQLVGVDFNAYNAGEVLGVNIKGIKSVNDNAFNGEYAKVLGGREYCADGTITSMGFAKEIGGATEAIVLDSENKFIPSENGYVYASGTDICIHLVHTGYKDHVYTEHEVSESSFDLTPYFPNGMHGINGVRDSVTPKKATQRIGIRDYIEGDENDTLVMTDGKKTIYQLAEPIETEIDPQLNMNYKVWDFGTEELLTDSKSAPVLARTIYGFNATDTIRGNKAKNEEQDVRLHTLESEVVRVGDYQPDLSVGVADQLAGQDEPTASEINFRKSGGGAILDGNARIEAIKGNSVVLEGEVIHMNVQSLESVGVNQWDEEWELGAFDTKTGQPLVNNDAIRTKGRFKILGGQEYFAHAPTNNMFAHFYDAQGDLIKGVSGQYNYVEIGNKKWMSPSDATSMTFYVIGQSTYNSDICINLSDASINGKYFPYVKRMQSLDIIRKYFPDGMKSAGSAHDEIRYNKTTQKWEAVQRIGSVDMGSLDIKKSAYEYTYYAPINDIKLPTDYVERTNGFVCAKYSASAHYAVAEMEDKTMLRSGDGNIFIKDSAYTDAASFKAAMQGVILYYEAAEWEWVELDKEDQTRNFDYQVWNGGTEQAIAEGQTSPLKADIVYGFNAYGTIKQLKEQMATLMTQMAQMQTAMASVTSNNNN